MSASRFNKVLQHLIASGHTDLAGLSEGSKLALAQALEAASKQQQVAASGDSLLFLQTGEQRVQGSGGMLEPAALLTADAHTAGGPAGASAGESLAAAAGAAASVGSAAAGASAAGAAAAGSLPGSSGSAVDSSGLSNEAYGKLEAEARNVLGMSSSLAAGAAGRLAAQAGVEAGLSSSSSSRAAASAEAAAAAEAAFQKLMAEADGKRQALQDVRFKFREQMQVQGTNPKANTAGAFDSATGVQEPTPECKRILNSWLAKCVFGPA